MPFSFDGHFICCGLISAISALAWDKPAYQKRLANWPNNALIYLNINRVFKIRS
jgi:hypothetical protein